MSPAHRRVAVRATPFEVNRHHRALVFRFYGCHKTVSDRSWHTIRSAAGRKISTGKRRTPSEVKSRQLMSWSACTTVPGLVAMQSGDDLSLVTLRITKSRDDLSIASNAPHIRLWCIRLFSGVSSVLSRDASGSPVPAFPNIDVK